MKKLLGLALVLALVACSSKEKEAPTAPVGSGSAAAAVEPAPPAAPPPATGSAAGSGSGSAAAAGSAAGSAAAGSAAAGSGEVAAGGFDFDKLSHDDKMKFMRDKVVTTMKPLFQDFDKAKYADFGCKTCHGKDPKKSKYKMPSPDLPALDFAALEAGKQKPKTAEFMGKVVKPQMAKLLQQPEMTETNPKGFGCLECHTQKK